MSLITVERIKLFSTRSPWWCMIIAAVLSIGLASLATGLASGPDEAQITPAMSQFGVNLGQMVIMVMAALAVTTEYRFGTIRTSFQAVPQLVGYVSFDRRQLGEQRLDPRLNVFERSR